MLTTPVKTWNGCAKAAQNWPVNGTSQATCSVLLGSVDHGDATCYMSQRSKELKPANTAASNSAFGRARVEVGDQWRCATQSFGQQVLRLSAKVFAKNIHWRQLVLCRLAPLLRVSYVPEPTSKLVQGRVHVNRQMHDFCV